MLEGTGIHVHQDAHPLVCSLVGSHSTVVVQLYPHARSRTHRPRVEIRSHDDPMQVTSWNLDDLYQREALLRALYAIGFFS